jgi:CSLREA domain-containing protein
MGAKKGGVVMRFLISSTKGFFSILFLSFFLLLFFPHLSPAATIHVTTTTDEVADNGQCSLREAIRASNFSSNGGDSTCETGEATGNVIELQAGALYQLILPGHDQNGASGDLPIKHVDLTINGHGATIRQTVPGERVFNDNQENASISNLILNDLIITGGARGTNSGDDGGGIFFTGDPTHSLTLNNCWVDHNKADDGGGIFSFCDTGTCTVTINNSTISNNEAQSAGSGSGGGLNVSAGVILNINNSTISTNTGGSGGAIHLGSTANIASTTIFNNTATGGGGGGILFNDTNPTLTIKNSILAGNTDADGISVDCAPTGNETITSGGHNIFGDLSACNVTTSTGDQSGINDPQLGLLQNNGGLADTHLPKSGGPVIDNGDPAGCTDTSGGTLTTDERGSPRAVDGDKNGSAICDVGAVELDVCGNGVVGAGEECDGGQCCTASCQFASSGTTCNGGTCNATGACVPSGGGGGGGGGCRLETTDVAGGFATIFWLSVAVAGLVVVRRRG